MNNIPPDEDEPDDGLNERDGDMDKVLKFIAVIAIVCVIVGILGSLYSCAGVYENHRAKSSEGQLYKMVP